MVKRIFGAFVISFIILFPSKAQQFVGINGGYSLFSMKSLKTNQEEMCADLPVDAMVLETFPGYVNFGADYTLKTGKFCFRAVIGHTSTGGRIYYSDYSGFIAIDQTVRMTYIGPQVSINLSHSDDIGMYLGLQAPTYFNTVRYSSKERVMTSEGVETMRFTSVNLAFGPFMEAHKQLKKFLFRMQLGYEVHVPGKLYFDREDDLYMIDNRGDAVTVDAGGLRVIGGVAFQFK
jgi:hypothetical protein